MGGLGNISYGIQLNLKYMKLSTDFLMYILFCVHSRKLQNKETQILAKYLYKIALKMTNPK